MMTLISAVTTVDNRSFFEKAVQHGLETGLLTPENLAKFIADGPKGIVQIADHFGTAYLRTDLETATVRMTNLISLYLEDCSNGNLSTAAMSLRDNSLLSQSRGGSEMLKRLYAMPSETSLHPRMADAFGQKVFVNERTFAFPMTASRYREQVKACQANQQQIDFAHWLGKKLQARPHDYEDFNAEEVIRSAMLVLFVSAKSLEMPTKRQFVAYIEALRKKTFKRKIATLDHFLVGAPDAFQTLARQFLQSFIEKTLPQLRDSQKSPDEILYGEAQGAFFIREVPEEDVAAYDKLVAKEWVRITKGNADDPAVLATIFLLIATGHAPKAAALLKDAKSIISHFRQNGFDTLAVNTFIDENAPFEQREDLKILWSHDLRPDAEIHLADTDPQMPDTYMDRALRHFKRTCVGTWKDRER